MSCADCPELVVGFLAREVQLTLNRVLRIKELTNEFNGLFRDLAPAILDDLTGFVAAIPAPPVFNLSSIVGFFTCPLTPLAVADFININDLTTADVQTVAKVMKRLFKAESGKVIADSEDRFRNLRSYRPLSLMRLFLQATKLTVGDLPEFTTEYPVNLARCLLVRDQCPEIYDSDDRPFKFLVQAVTDWNFDGILPSGIESNAEPVMRLLATAEVKLAAWASLGTLII